MRKRNKKFNPNNIISLEVTTFGYTEIKMGRYASNDMLTVIPCCSRSLGQGSITGNATVSIER